MDIKILIADEDRMYLEDAKEHLDKTGRYLTDICPLEDIYSIDIEGYDIAILPAVFTESLPGDNIVPMYPEFHTGKGFAKYSGKDGLLACVEKNAQKIRKKEGSCYLVSFFMLHDISKGKQFIKRMLDEIKEHDRSVLIINFSYSLKDISKTPISSSDLMFYMTSAVEEKNEFIGGILKSDKNWLYLNGLNSMHEIFELEGERLTQVIEGIKEIRGYEYIFILAEPGIRQSLYRLGAKTDLNIFFMDNADSLTDEIIKGAPENYRILPAVYNLSKQVKAPDDKRCYSVFPCGSRNSIIRRLDGIFEQIEG